MLSILYIKIKLNYNFKIPLQKCYVLIYSWNLRTFGVPLFVFRGGLSGIRSLLSRCLG